MRANLTPQEKQSMLDMLRIASDEMLSVLWKTITSNAGGVTGMDPDLLKAFYDEFDRRPGLLESMTESRKRKTMKTTIPKLRKTIRKLIKENVQDTLRGSSWAESAEQDEFDEMSDEFYVDQLMLQLYQSGDYRNLDELLDDNVAYEDVKLKAQSEFPELPDSEFQQIWLQAEFVHQT